MVALNLFVRARYSSFVPGRTQAPLPVLVLHQSPLWFLIKTVFGI